ncbi:MAG: polysaccharide deacetylase family protein [Variibacter sp.]
MNEMKLPHHDRYDYSALPRRANYDWPGGKRLAVYLGINIEHFAFGTGLGHAVSTELPQPDPRTFSWRDYGNRVGVWRLFDLLDELQLPACHLVNTTIFDYAPEILEPIKARKDEIIGHGRTNAERQGQMWEEDEARLIAQVRDAIAKHSGRAPRGWMGPWMSQSRVTPDLLKEAGFDFLMDWPCDDQPIWMRTRSGPLMSVPYPLEINDSPMMLVRHHTAVDFEQMIVDQFDEMIEQAERQPLVCGIALHTMIVGQPYRLRALRRALKHIVEHPKRDKVWFTRPGEIFDHCASLKAGTMPGTKV